MRVTGFVAPYLVQRGFWRKVGSNQYDVFIRTRDAKVMCSGEKTPDMLGDRLEINGFFNIPLNTSDAVKQGWFPGNCINKMGIHYSYDLAAPGSISWNASTLLPVQPMYDAKRATINAVLFNIPHWEYVRIRSSLHTHQSVKIDPLSYLQPIQTEPIGEFEGPFPNNLFCWNWCANTGCNFPGVDLWSTMHWLLVDPTTVSCEGAPCSLY